MITENMRSEACRVLNERGKGNAITITDVYAMLEAAFVVSGNDTVTITRKQLDGILRAAYPFSTSKERDTIGNSVVRND